jgi:hypothetical protein
MGSVYKSTTPISETSVAKTYSVSGIERMKASQECCKETHPLLRADLMIRESLEIRRNALHLCAVMQGRCWLIDNVPEDTMQCLQ